MWGTRSTRGKPSSFIHSLSYPIPSLALRRRQAQTGRIGASSHKMDYVAQDLLSLKGYTNCIISSKLMANLLNGWILTICGVALVRVCDPQGYTV